MRGRACRLFAAVILLGASRLVWAVNFNSPAVYLPGSNTQAFVVADFNGDGKPDMAVVANDAANNGYTPEYIGILLNNGDGTFRQVAQYASTLPFGIAAGDFNGDGKIDLAYGDNNGVWLLTGNGDGTFQQTHLATYGGILGGQVLALDFNGDGKLDLIVGLASEGESFELFLGNGDGTFRASPLSLPGTYLAGPLQVADFNGDGKPDLAEVEQSSYNHDSIQVFLNNGTHTLTQMPVHGMTAQQIAVADFNGDGIPDIVAIPPEGGHAGILLGNGNGTFQSPFYVGPEAGSVATADVNGDGKADLIEGLITSGGQTQSQTLVLLGNGDGTFQPGTRFQPSGGPIAVADFNGDGVNDFAIANGNINAGGGGGVCIVLSQPGGFVQPQNVPAPAPPIAILTADFNGDGHPDLAVLSQGVSILLGNGNGSFQPWTSYPAGRTPRTFAVGDFNGDGTPDLVILDLDNVSILLGNGDGSFRSGGYASQLPADGVAVGDFNGDGKLDLALTKGEAVTILLGNGDGTFQPPTAFQAGGIAGPVAATDINQDGKLDLVVLDTSEKAHVTVLLGNGDGTFQAPASYFIGKYAYSMAVGDLDGDGYPDVAVVGNRQVVVLLSAHNGTFRSMAQYELNDGGGIAIGDFDGDGIPDLAVTMARATEEGNVSVLTGIGGGQFSLPPVGFLAEAGLGENSSMVSVLALADFNGDGMLDIAVPNPSPDNITVLTNTTPRSRP